LKDQPESKDIDLSEAENLLTEGRIRIDNALRPKGRTKKEAVITARNILVELITEFRALLPNKYKALNYYEYYLHKDPKLIEMLKR